ncbi:hypothetical protein [Kangiella sp. M94]
MSQAWATAGRPYIMFAISKKTAGSGFKELKSSNEIALLQLLSLGILVGCPYILDYYRELLEKSQLDAQ